MNSSRSHSQQVVKLGDQFTLGVCVEGGNGLALGDTRSREYLENSLLPTRGPEGASATPAVLCSAEICFVQASISHIFFPSPRLTQRVWMGASACCCGCNSMHLSTWVYGPVCTRECSWNSVRDSEHS